MEGWEEREEERENVERAKEGGEEERRARAHPSQSMRAPQVPPFEEREETMTGREGGVKIDRLGRGESRGKGEEEGREGVYALAKELISSSFLPSLPRRPCSPWLST